jgi:pyruvate-ferredoxin/flavodoxin oxidoreductase
LEHVEFVALNDVNAFNLENPLMGLSEGGMVFVQSPYTEPATVWNSVPAWARNVLCEKQARLFALDTVGIAKEVSSRADLQQRMQGIVLLGIFLRITPFQSDLGLTEEAVFQGVEKSVRKYFGKRGDRVVQDNLQAIRRGYHEVIEVSRDVMLSTAVHDKANAALRVM